MDKKVSLRIRVRLEPELEELAGGLQPHQRRALARKLGRWQRQLIISAAIIEADQTPKAPPKRLALIPREKALRN